MALNCGPVGGWASMDTRHWPQGRGKFMTPDIPARADEGGRTFVWRYCGSVGGQRSVGGQFHGGQIRAEWRANDKTQGDVNVSIGRPLGEKEWQLVNKYIYIKYMVHYNF